MSMHSFGLGIQDTLSMHTTICLAPSPTYGGNSTNSEPTQLPKLYPFPDCVTR